MMKTEHLGSYSSQNDYYQLWVEKNKENQRLIGQLLDSKKVITTLHLKLSDILNYIKIFEVNQESANYINQEESTDESTLCISVEPGGNQLSFLTATQSEFVEMEFETENEATTAALQCDVTMPTIQHSELSSKPSESQVTSNHTQKEPTNSNEDMLLSCDEEQISCQQAKRRKISKVRYEKKRMALKRLARRDSQTQVAKNSGVSQPSVCNLVKIIHLESSSDENESTVDKTALNCQSTSVSKPTCRRRSQRNAGKVSRLSEVTKQRALKRVDHGKSQNKISEDLGVSQATLSLRSLCLEYSSDKKGQTIEKTTLDCQCPSLSKQISCRRAERKQRNTQLRNENKEIALKKLERGEAQWRIANELGVCQATVSNWAKSLAYTSDKEPSKEKESTSGFQCLTLSKQVEELSEKSSLCSPIDHLNTVSEVNQSSTPQESQCQFVELESEPGTSSKEATSKLQCETNIPTTSQLEQEQIGTQIITEQTNQRIQTFVSNEDMNMTCDVQPSEDSEKTPNQWSLRRQNKQQKVLQEVSSQKGNQLPEEQLDSDFIVSYYQSSFCANRGQTETDSSEKSEHCGNLTMNVFECFQTDSQEVQDKKKDTSHLDNTIDGLLFSSTESTQEMAAQGQELESVDFSVFSSRDVACQSATAYDTIMVLNDGTEGRPSVLPDNIGELLIRDFNQAIQSKNSEAEATCQAIQPLSILANPSHSLCSFTPVEDKEGKDKNVKNLQKKQEHTPMKNCNMKEISSSEVPVDSPINSSKAEVRGAPFDLKRKRTEFAKLTDENQHQSRLLEDGKTVAENLAGETNLAKLKKMCAPENILHSPTHVQIAGYTQAPLTGNLLFNKALTQEKAESVHSLGGARINTPFLISILAKPVDIDMKVMTNAILAESRKKNPNKFKAEPGNPKPRKRCVPKKLAEGLVSPVLSLIPGTKPSQGETPFSETAVPTFKKALELPKNISSKFHISPISKASISPSSPPIALSGTIKYDSSSTEDVTVMVENKTENAAMLEQEKGEQEPFQKQENPKNSQLNLKNNFCEECGKYLATSYNLRRHMKTVHYKR